MLTGRVRSIVAIAGMFTALTQLAGCDHTPRYAYGFSNTCTFPIDVAMIVDGQSLSASVIEVWPDSHRKYAVFSDDPRATARLSLNASEGDPLNTVERSFPVAVGDVDHAPDSSKPLDIVIDGELCKGLDPGASGG